MKEVEKVHAEKRAALIQSINTKEDFQQAIAPVAERLTTSESLNIAAYKKTRCILMRGHQILEPDDYWSEVDLVGLSRQDAMEMVKDEIRDATVSAISAPFFDYLDDILKRVRKLSREIKAGKCCLK
jgi:hypothetical protein